MKTFHPRAAGVVAALALAASTPFKNTVVAASAKTVPPERRRAESMASSFDAGDYYQTPQGKRPLRRLAGVLAVDFAGKEIAPDVLPAPPGYSRERNGGSGPHLFKTTAAGQDRPRLRPAAYQAALDTARRAPGVRCANPVFIDVESGLQQIATEQILLKLKPGVDSRKYFGAAWPRVRHLFGTTDEFILTLPGATAETMLAEVNRHAARTDVEWAEPDFIGEIVPSYTPSDPFYFKQWHLHNEGQLGGKPGADAKLSEAWDITTGSPDIVVAVIDNGVDLGHGDLAPNVFFNDAEAPDFFDGFDGVDNDDNGYVDDYSGWDFVSNDNDPLPDYSGDYHGTCVAGIAVAAQGNDFGGVGAAFGCRLLALKIYNRIHFASVSRVAAAFRYAAGLNAEGRSVRRGADIINVSLHFSESTALNSAIYVAATRGRGGLGCPIFCSAGNEAAAWTVGRVRIESEGEHTVRWEYCKNAADSGLIGADTVWLDAVEFPDGTVESFEGDSLSPGWRTGGAAPWRQVQEGVAGNHALTGLDGPGAHAMRAGRITHNQATWIEITTNLAAGYLYYRAWVSSEGSASHPRDALRLFVDGETNIVRSGVPAIASGVAYPASHPSTIAVGASTDFDYRADYSRYGAKLDFVAPSSGGHARVFTTDLAYGAGLNDGTFEDDAFTSDFSGTSAASPLAAGIAALMLSVNPALTAEEVRKVLRDTCDKIGGVTYNATGRNTLYGSGRVNAARAVQAARADLAIHATLAPAIANVGCPSTYVLVVTNQSAVPAGTLTVTDELPPNVAFHSATPAPVTQEGNKITFAIRRLRAHESATLRISVTNLTLTTNLNVASISSATLDPNPEDNSCTNETVVLPMPAVSISDAVVAEGDTGATNAVFVVSLSNPSGKTVTVRYATATNTALAGGDFIPTSGLLTFATGQTNKTLAVRVPGDRRHEWDEIFFVNLTNAVNATLDRAQGLGTILDNDPPPALSVADAAVTEGNAGAFNAIFPVRLSAASGREVTVRYLTLPGTATEGLDYAGANGVLTFRPGVVLQNIVVPIHGDLSRESNETFLVTLENPTNAVIARAQAVGTIRNNDPPPRLFIADTTVTEGESGTTDAMFAVRLSAASGLPITVRYFTTNGTARAELDYLSTNGVLVFPPGETNQVIFVPVLGDTLSESNETFWVKLISPTNATLGHTFGVGTILDNDPLPLLAIADAAVHKPTSGTTNAVFTVSLTPPSGRVVTVKYATTNGTALAGQNYIVRAGTLTFPPGTTTQTVAVVVKSDAQINLEQNFFVNLSAVVNATLDDAQGRGTIGGEFPVLAAARMVANRMCLTFTAVAGRRYVVECARDVSGATGWRPVPGAENIAGRGALMEVTDPVPANQPQCFYRIRCLPR